MAHLHRRAGFGATRAELLRDVAAGPEASVERLFQPAPLPPEDAEAIDGLRQTARSSSNLDLLKVCWLNRILHGPDPLREKLTLFWHGHFATSNKKVESVALMDRQNETLRTHALGGFAALLEAIDRRPGHARLARRRDQQEGQAQRELRPRVPRAVHPGRRALHRARRPRGRPGLHRLGPAGFPRRLPGDAGLRPRARAGRRRAQDVPRPDGPLGAVGHRPDHARAPRGRDLPGAQALPLLRQRVRHARPRADRAAGRGGQAARVRHRARSWRSSSARGTSTPARPIASGSSRRWSSAPGWCGCSRSRARRSTRWRSRPPATRRARSCSPRPTSRAGSAARSGSTAARCSSAPTGPPTSSGAAPRTAWRRSIPLAWAARYKLPADRAAGAFLDLLLQDDLGDEARRLVLDAGRDGSPDGLRKALQRLANCPEFQLA